MTVFGTSYAMRIWMDPAKLERFALMPSDVVSALNSQNAQVSAGQLGALPAVGDQMLNASITARTKLQSVDEFKAIVLKSAPDGSVVTMGDIAREMGWYRLPIPGLAVSGAAELISRVPLMPSALEWIHAVRVPSIMSTERAKQKLGWEPRHDAHQTLRATVAGAGEK